MRIVAVTFMFAVFALAARAAGPAPKPGEYIAEGGWGRLVVGAADRWGTPFSLESVGANFHICNLEGHIVGGDARLEGDDDEPPCVVSFSPVAGGLRVSGDAPSCRQYCGARAGFDGVYLQPAKGCGDAARRATRSRFKQLYDSKRYTQALVTLSPLPTTCKRTLGALEQGELVNDIAITQYRLGQREACVRTLAPLAENAALSEDEVREGYPPSDAEAWLPIIKAARFNLGLCRSKAR
jgi:hypothetical protein